MPPRRNDGEEVSLGRGDADSVAASWTSGKLDNRKTFQDGGNNSCIKPFPAPNVRLTPADWGDHLPSSPLAGEDNNIILRHLWRCGGVAMQQECLERVE